jgi:hypothetical protein
MEAIEKEAKLNHDIANLKAKFVSRTYLQGAHIILPPWILEIFSEQVCLTFRDIKCERIMCKWTIGAAGWALRF